MNPKFLTVYALLDDESQEVFEGYRKILLQKGIVGTQTNDIPYHISLGSYPVEKREELMEQVQTVCAQMSAFRVSLTHLADFGNCVLFAEPKICPEILNLRSLFENDYPKVFPYHPHVTILQDSVPHVLLAKELLLPVYQKREAAIVGIELGEFFPAERIIQRRFSGGSAEQF